MKLTIALTVVVFSLLSNALGQNEKPMNAKPTIVLVHGLWADGSSWNKVITPLVEDGFEVISVQNPTTTLEDDVAAANAAIERAKGDVILVGHSWGGFVITESGAHPKVKGLVYVAAFAPDKGETVPTLSANAAPTKLSDFLKETNGLLTVSKEGVFKVFAGDLPKSEQEVIYVVQQPASPKVFAGVGQQAAWKTKPSWYVVASQDKTINPELEAWMAKRAKSKTTVLEASHVAMLSKPKEVLEVILDAVQSTSK
ncbi:alpha/beta hydrolase [Roseimicrobium sp. ORNL1]|nr:alpha/beta hydrolase [Roseimicrobium sp. ORNL1]